jgi:hypothetical protein
MVRLFHWVCGPRFLSTRTSSPQRGRFRPEVEALEDRVTPSTFLEPVADYQTDFAATGTLTPGWQYLWNQPDNWVAGGAIGDVTTGSIGNSASFMPLVFAGAGLWTPSGNTDFAHDPDGYLRLAPWGGHPGRGTSYPAGNLERYAIAAYTVTSSGMYELDNATLGRPSTVTGPGIDGIDVLVFVNNTGSSPLLSQTVPTGGSLITFNTSLGLLNAGDTVYVAVGAMASDAYDGFTLEFTLNQVFTLEGGADGAGHRPYSTPLITRRANMPSDPNEGLMAENILIQRNTFDTIGLSSNYPNTDRNAAIVVTPLKWNGSTEVVTGVPSYAFRSLTVRSNTFLNWSMQALLVRNATNVWIVLNTFDAPQANGDTEDYFLDLLELGPAKLC